MVNNCKRGCVSLLKGGLAGQKLAMISVECCSVRCYCNVAVVEYRICTNFLRDVIFVDNLNPGFSQFYFQGSFYCYQPLTSIIMHCDCFKNFEDLIFVHDTSYPRKQRKLRHYKICMHMVVL